MVGRTCANFNIREGRKKEKKGEEGGKKSGKEEGREEGMREVHARNAELLGRRFRRAVA